MRLTLLIVVLYIMTSLAPGANADAGERTSRDKWHQQAAPRKAAEKSKYKPWAAVTKDAQKHEGLFDIYTKDSDLYFAIGLDQMDKPMANFMNISKGIGTGFLLGGMPLGILETVMFDFHREKDVVQIRKLNPLFRSGGDPALDEAIDLSYGNSIVASLPILSESNGKVLVEMNRFFLSDASNIDWWLERAIGPTRMDPRKSAYGYVKAFPENVEIEGLMTFTPMSRMGLNLPSVPDERFIELGVRYSIRMLPEDPMKPRLADDRLGFYMSPYKDFSRDGRESFVVHHINRWRLEKKDPDAAMSEPVEPIVYYIDKTVPDRFRQYVRQGIEMWQPAFEEAGFTNAIVAKDPGDDPDYNAEDSRYNTIRWITSDNVSFNAIGPHRTDPRTGEILESDILIEAASVAGFRRGYRVYAGPSDFLDNDPSMLFLQNPAEHPEVNRYMEVLERVGWGCAMMSLGFSSGFELGEIVFMMEGSGMPVPDEYIGAAIARMTSHEVGHGIGLRHNFKSSASTPYDGLNDRALMEKIGQMGSIMDYATPNIARDRSKQGPYWTPVVGTYDHWVVKWGYTPFSGDLTPEEESAKLAAIANQASEKQNLYGTDEDTYPAGALDPNCMTWDLSDQPLKWADDRIAICRDILGDPRFADRVVSDGENYVGLRNAVHTLFIQMYYAGTRGIRYVGGQRTARPHRGADGGMMPLMPVPADEQRAALDFVARSMFAPDAWRVSPALLNMLQDDKSRNWQNSPFAFGRRFDFPYSSWVALLRRAALAQLLHPMRLQRMVDAQYSDSDALPVSELFRTLTDRIWMDEMTPVGSTANLQREQQAIYVSMLARMVVRPGIYGVADPPEAVALARLNLSRIAAAIDRTYQQPGLSDEANAHLAATRARIHRTVNPEMKSSF